MSDLPNTRIDPYAALRFPEYRDYIVASFILTISLMIQEVALGYELYSITKDPLVLGLIGLAEAIPFIGLSLFGGHVADRRSKRNIIRWSVGVMAVGSLVLHVVSRPEVRAGVSQRILIDVSYATVFLVGTCRAFQSPAASSLRAFLVPVRVYENAATWSSSSWQAGAIVGPAIGGVIFGWIGFSNTLLVVVVQMIGALILFSRIQDRPTPALSVSESLLLSIREGIAFVWKTKPILYAISLDLFSVLFGGVVAILPIYAQDILMVGARGLGILRAAPSFGAVLMLLVLARVSPMRNAWRNLMIAVTGFGVSILVFAVSPWMVLSTFALFLSGAFDSISVVIRHTLLQLWTPDEMRGRVMAVNGIFLSSSNEIGAFESGLAARLLGVVRSAVFGGIVTLVIVSVVFSRTRGLMKERLDRRPESVGR